MLFFLMETMNDIYGEGINLENEDVFVECESIRLEVVRVMIYQHVTANNINRNTFLAMLFTYVAYIIIYSGGIVINSYFYFCPGDIKIWYRS